jgi:hypothetical protein
VFVLSGLIWAALRGGGTPRGNHQYCVVSVWTNASVGAAWGEWNTSWEVTEFIWKTFYITAVAGFSFAHQSLLLLLADRPHVWVQRLLLLTLVSITAVAIMLIYPVVDGFDRIGELYWRLLGVLAILDVVGTIATPVIAKLVQSQQPK